MRRFLPCPQCVEEVGSGRRPARAPTSGAVVSTRMGRVLMTRNRWFQRRRPAAASAGALLALVAGAAAAPAVAAPSATADVGSPCPAPVPAATVTAGMRGEGLTVVRGSTPEPFAVEVLGVVRDGIGAGRDLAMVKLSDLPGRSVIGQNGVWAGISGSPVYVDGKLLGSVSYGFSSASP